MEFRLRRPCANCPFRTDVPPYLRGERAQEIARSVAGGSTFACHKTTVDSDDEEDIGRVVTESSQMCAGAMIAMEKAGQPNQMMRIVERLGMFDPSGLDLDAPVVASLSAFVEHHARPGEDEIEYEPEPCSVADIGCEAPAGFMDGGVAIRNVEIEPDATAPCDQCGEPVCASCASKKNGRRLCAVCADF